MKVFYKYILLISATLMLFFALGCASVKIQSVDSQNQVSVSAERLKERNIAFDGLRELIRQTNNEDSKEILAILESNSMMVVPTEKGYLDPIFGKQKEKIKIVVVLPRDAQYLWWNTVWFARDYALYFPALNAIALKQMEFFTPVFVGITIEHEGWHARYSKTHAGTENYTLMQKAEWERDAHEHSILLLSIVGGEKYKIFMKEEMQKFEAFVKSSPSGRELPIREKTYNKKLDDIFGVAKSFIEQEMRSSFVWVAGVFQYIDKHTEGTQAEKEIAKTKALYDAYARVEAR
jgi:hypothetical protein